MPQAATSDDFEFLVTCLKHIDNLPKPDFEKVARDTGAKNANAAYHRHWSLLRKLGLNTSNKTNATPATPSRSSSTATKKRGVSTQKSSKATAKVENKVLTDDSNDEAFERPTKKLKTENDSVLDDASDDEQD